MGRPLDRMAEKLEEFGTITMSAPLLSAPDPSFAFALDRPVDEYFREAKSETQGGASLLVQVLQQFALNAAAQAGPSDVQTPSASATPGSKTSGLLDSGAFKQPGALLPPNFSPTVSNRTALVTAAGDKAIESIFRVLGSPGEAQRFKGKIVVFAVATVSVDPGWRTRKDFAGDLTVRLGYERDEARGEVLEALVRDVHLDAGFRARIARDYRIEEPRDLAAVPSASFGVDVPSGWECENDACQEDDNYPLTVAVSPMTETQNLDLASASRRIDELSIALSFALYSAGYPVQAQAFEDFVKSQQLDVRTRTAAVAANSYSVSGGVFGYQVGPQLRGIEDPSSGQSGPANILDRQSFPVLIVLGLGTSDIRPRLGWNSQDGKIHVYEPMIMFRQMSRWLPLRKPWYSCGGMFLPRWSEEERLESLYELRLAQNRATAWGERATGQDARLREQINASKGALALAADRGEVLKFLGAGSFMHITLPVEYMVPDGVPQVPKLIDALPTEVTLVKTGNKIAPVKLSVAVVGDHLDQIVLSRVAVATGNATVLGKESGGVRRVDNTIVVPVEVRDASAPVMLELPFDPVRTHALDHGVRGSLYTRPILVRVVETASATTPRAVKTAPKTPTPTPTKKDTNTGAAKKGPPDTPAKKQ
jgi:hypothetical protein